MSADTLAAEILERITRHDSKRPANADDVAALIGGDERAYWAAIEQLKATRQINAAHIKRASDPAPWLAIWPTGARVGMDSWKTLNANGHFAIRHTATPWRFPQSPAVRRDLEDSTVKNRSPELAQQRRKQLVALVEGKTLAEGLRAQDLAAQLGISVEGVSYLVGSLASGGRVARGNIPGQRADRIYDPRATAPAAETPAAQPVEAPDHFADVGKMVQEDRIVAGLAAIADALGEMEPESAPTEAAPNVLTQPGRPAFALWDDGTLSIYTPNEDIDLPPAAVLRLARLLGVPGVLPLGANA